MKKLFLIALMVLAISGAAMAQHVFAPSTTFNYSSHSMYTAAAAQFIELDEASGYIWIACGGTFNPDVVYIFDMNGVEAPFSPISTGLSSLGVVTGFRQTSGIAIDRSTTPHIAYVIVDHGAGLEQHFISKFVAGTGQPLNGLDSNSGIPAALSRLGDAQFDNAGRLFITHKVGYTAWALNKDNGRSLSISGSDDTCIWNSAGAGGSVRRGAGVTADGNTMYIANESGDVVFKLTGTASSLNGTTQVTYDVSTFASYTLNDNPSACEVDSAGNVYVSITGLTGGDQATQDKVDIYNAAGTLLETITVNDIGQNMFAKDTQAFNPRGVAFSNANPASNVLWVARFQTIFFDYPVGVGGDSGPVAVFTTPSVINDWKTYSF